MGHLTPMLLLIMGSAIIYWSVRHWTVIKQAGTHYQVMATAVFRLLVNAMVGFGIWCVLAALSWGPI